MIFNYNFIIYLILFKLFAIKAFIPESGPVPILDTALPLICEALAAGVVGVAKSISGETATSFCIKAYHLIF